MISTGCVFPFPVRVPVPTSRRLTALIASEVALAVPDVDKLAVEVADAFREYQAAPFA
jgi:hypothetical protein